MQLYWNQSCFARSSTDMQMNKSFHFSILQWVIEEIEINKVRMIKQTYVPLSCETKESSVWFSTISAFPKVAPWARLQWSQVELTGARYIPLVLSFITRRQAFDPFWENEEGFVPHRDAMSSWQARKIERELWFKMCVVMIGQLV